MNRIAKEVAKKFPHVLIDTLAYQYTRKAPNTPVPEPNVIVRLCSIECDFAKPLSDPVNAAFDRDLVAWGKLTSRLYM